MESGNKVKLLRILQILMETDPEHPIPTREIIARLHRYGIQSERKSIQRDIRLLIDCGYDIYRDSNPRRGYYVGSRSLEFWEVKVLIDAVASGCFLSPEDTDSLIGKLLTFASVSQQEALCGMLLPTTGNPHIRGITKYNIDAVLSAIIHKKLLTFRYSDLTPDGSYRLRKNGKIYRASPYMLVWHNQRYYLAANTEGYDDISMYRLDRMQDVLPTAEPTRPLPTIDGYLGEGWLRDYLGGSFDMFVGEEITLVLQFGKEMLGPMLDHFGKSAITQKVDGSFLMEKQVLESGGLYRFLLEHCMDCQVLAPLHVRSEVAETLRSAAERYSQDPHR